MSAIKLIISGCKEMGSDIKVAAAFTILGITAATFGITYMLGTTNILATCACTEAMNVKDILKEGIE